MSDNLIITIGHQYGSGAHELGRALAEKLGINFYDKELIEAASEASGLSPEIIKANKDTKFNSFFYSLVGDSHFGAPQSTPLSQQVFLAQFETIKKIADKESCIILGRCADYALKDYPNKVSVFTHADLEYRVERIMRLLDMPRDKALSTIPTADKKRANYYNFYSDSKWGVASTYDLTINIAKSGAEGAAQIVYDFIKARGILKED